MMDKVLQGKRVLFFSWPFYEYPGKIKKKLEEMGADVTYYSSAPTDNFLKVRFLERFESLKKRYFKDIINEISHHSYDFVFMINAAIFTEYFLQDLQMICKDSCKILYSWDSLAVYPSVQKLHKYFDYVYSFDSNDVKNNDYMIFLPLFFCDDMYEEITVQNLKYDLSFIGFGHTERYNFINVIKNFAEKNGFTHYFRLYLPSKIHFFRGKYIKKLFKTAKISDFVYKPISLEMTKKIIHESKIVVDIELSNQSGLTMRTIETHGMRKKLITTNKNILNYDFYDPQNICVVDRKMPVISPEFVTSSYKALPENLYNKYALSSWLRVIFRCENEN